MTKKAYQLKITLEGSKPPIWRRMVVPSNTLLPDLHKIIQSTMGWTHSHLHQFIVDGVFYSLPDDWDETSVDYRKLKTDKFLKKKGDAIKYEYDFGDSWLHEILLEEILPVEAGKKYPAAIDGSRACPPEDCGGIWGYRRLLEIMENPQHEEFEQMREWLGGDFDPEAFDLESINRLLQSRNYGVDSFEE